MVIGRQMDMTDHILEMSDPLSMAVTERDKTVLELVRDAGQTTGHAGLPADCANRAS